MPVKICGAFQRWSVWGERGPASRHHPGPHGAGTRPHAGQDGDATRWGRTTAACNGDSGQPSTRKVMEPSLSADLTDARLPIYHKQKISRFSKGETGHE